VSEKTWAPAADSKHLFNSNQKAGSKVAPEPEQERITLVIDKRAGVVSKCGPSASNRHTMIENIAVIVIVVVIVEVENGCLDSKILFSIEFPVFH
jgi:hypothetical protein